MAWIRLWRNCSKMRGSSLAICLNFKEIGCNVLRRIRHNSHNHPSGDPEPSSADTRITDELQQALAMVDVRLLDHFVVGEGRPVSFAERGLLSPPQPRLFG